jgi:hypothetical protein
MLHLGFFFLVRTLSQCENITFDQSPSPLHLLQDFVGSDRALLADELAGKYSGLVQFPLFGQALVLTYNVDGLSASDPEYLVRRNPLLVLLRTSPKIGALDVARFVGL